MTLTPTPAPHQANRWVFLGVISLGLLMIGLDNSVLYTALPHLTQSLHATSMQSLWVINAYPLVLSGLLLGTGTLGDRIGHRRMFTVGLVLFGLASLGAAFAPGAWELVAARAVLGFAAAVMMPATLALIRFAFTNERERNTAIGIWGSIAVIGAGAGPVVGGFLLEHFYWGSVFLINVPIVLIALALTQATAPPNRPNPAKSWDVVSSAYAMVTLASLTLAIKETARGSYGIAAAALAVSVVGGFLFARRQRRLPDPLLTFDIFRSRIFAGGVAAAFGGMFALSGLELVTTQKLQLADAASPLSAGLTVAIAAVAAIPFSALGGALLHRVGFLPLIAGGFAVLTVAIGLGAWATGPGAGTQHQGWFYLAMALIGVGAGLTMSVSSTAIIGAAPLHRTGMAAGVEEVSYEFGTLITVAVTGSLLPAFLNAHLPEHLKGLGLEAMYVPDEAASASAAYGSAYLDVLLVLGAVTTAFAAYTAWAFRDNPKSGGAHAAHE